MSKIDPSVNTEHVELTCRNHPELRWFTKNIDFIGARSIFFQPGSDYSVKECDCPINDLVLLPETNTNTNPPATAEGN